MYVDYTGVILYTPIFPNKNHKVSPGVAAGLSILSFGCWTVLDIEFRM